MARDAGVVGSAGIDPELLIVVVAWIALLVLQTDAMFRIQHTDPWVRGDAHRTSRTITVQVGFIYFLIRPKSC